MKLTISSGKDKFTKYYLLVHNSSFSSSNTTLLDLPGLWLRRCRQSDHNNLTTTSSLLPRPSASLSMPRINHNKIIFMHSSFLNKQYHFKIIIKISLKIEGNNYVSNMFMCIFKCIWLDLSFCKTADKICMFLFLLKYNIHCSRVILCINDSAGIILFSLISRE